jgi:hypothetical protein
MVTNRVSYIEFPLLGVSTLTFTHVNRKFRKNIVFVGKKHARAKFSEAMTFVVLGEKNIRALKRLSVELFGAPTFFCVEYSDVISS